MYQAQVSNAHDYLMQMFIYSIPLRDQLKWFEITPVVCNMFVLEFLLLNDPLDGSYILFLFFSKSPKEPLVSNTVQQSLGCLLGKSIIVCLV